MDAGFCRNGGKENRLFVMINGWAGQKKGEKKGRRDFKTSFSAICGGFMPERIREGFPVGLDENLREEERDIGKREKEEKQKKEYKKMFPRVGGVSLDPVREREEKVFFIIQSDIFPFRLHQVVLLQIML